VTAVHRLAPHTKVARQTAIADIVGGLAVRSQAELGERLAGRGIQVTQATLSRDLEELGATKAHGRYVLTAEPGPWPAADAPGRLARLAEELLVGAERAQHTVVVRTPPGGAQLLASAIDRGTLAGVVGTVAGDDTVLIVCRDDRAARETTSALLALAEGQ
jgi:transcriptional regulator of arginine metabolism